MNVFKVADSFCLAVPVAKKPKRKRGNKAYRKKHVLVRRDGNDRAIENYPTVTKQERPCLYRPAILEGNSICPCQK